MGKSIFFFKIFVFYIFFILTPLELAYSSTFNSFKWIIKPNKPIQNKPFELIFSFSYVGDKKLDFSFELDGCELLKKSLKELEKINKIIDDKFITTRKMEYKYTFKARSFGSFDINKIKISDGLFEKRIKKISFFVNKELVKRNDYYFVGEVSKENFF